MTTTTPKNNDDNPLTIEQVMQQIEDLRREKDAIQTQTEGKRAQWQAESKKRWAESEVENERMRKESIEARQCLEESLHQ